MEDNVRDIIEGLNPEQKKAVSQIEGPVLIVAGAGSGKTRVLTCRIANILSKGVPASRVLSLTFTKKAAEEMKERVVSMVGRRTARGVVMGTFHSVFIRFLRDYAAALGYPPQFTIYDTSDSLALVKTCLKELGLDDKTYKPKSVLSRISEAKNNLVSPAAYVANSQAVEHDRNVKMPRLAEVYDLYWRKCRAAGVMDFDDILFEMNILFRDNPSALEEIASRFDYILVDEYQDTNRAQYLILKKLAQLHRNICVVGDDSQSIYAFRGARIENILNFQKDYPQNHIFRLEQNYRSTRTIVDAANSLISHNENRIPKKCFSAAEQGELIHLIKAFSEQEEAMLVVSSIVDTVRKQGASYQDFAVLYRTNAQSRALEEALRRRNIPYLIYSGNSFFERAEVKDLMAYFKLSVNLADDESFKRVVNKPARGIGDTSMAALAAAAQDRKVSLFEAAFLPGLETYGLKNASAMKIRQFCDMMLRFNQRTAAEDAYRLAMDIAMESGLLQFYKSDTSVEGQARYANIEELLNSIVSYREQRENDAYEEALAGDADDASAASRASGITVTLPEYLENIALLSAVDTDEDGSNKVSLMTVHSSKGLEFPYVFVVGMEENLFPGTSAMSRPSEMEEERRLFYVAITRAKKAVKLSFSASRMRNGKSESNPVSRFVREIKSDYIDNPLRESGTPEGMKQDRADMFLSSVRSGGFSSGGYSSRGAFPARDPRPLPANSSSFQNREPGIQPRPTRIPGFQRPEKRVPDESFIPSPIDDLRVGQRVEHNRFGFGNIRQLSNVQKPDDAKAVISFDDFGEKILLLKYAKLRIIE